MSNDPPVSGTPEQAQKKAPLTAVDFLKGVRDNFVFISAMTVIVGVDLSMAFLASYLSVFDWHLLLFVQYADVGTFGLISIGLLASSFSFLQMFANFFLSAVENDWRVSPWFMRMATIILWLVLAFVFVAHWRGNRDWNVMFGALSIYGSLTLITSTIEIVANGTWPTPRQISLMIFFVISNAILIGQWMGYSVKETSAFNQDVYLKDQTIEEAKLVIVMSRDTVLLKAGTLVIVPTGDITKFIGEQTPKLPATN